MGSWMKYVSKTNNNCKFIAIIKLDVTRAAAAHKNADVLPNLTSEAAVSIRLSHA